MPFAISCIYRFCGIRSRQELLDLIFRKGGLDKTWAPSRRIFQGPSVLPRRPCMLAMVSYMHSKSTSVSVKGLVAIMRCRYRICFRWLSNMVFVLSSQILLELALFHLHLEYTDMITVWKEPAIFKNLHTEIAASLPIVTTKTTAIALKYLLNQFSIEANFTLI